jgi:hypothetical protein
LGARARTTGGNREIGKRSDVLLFGQFRELPRRCAKKQRRIGDE